MNAPRAEVLDCPGLGPPLGLYSHVSRHASGLIFVAGQLAVDTDGNVVGTDLASQMRQVFHNLQQALVAANASLEDVLKFTTFLTTRDDIPSFVATRKTLFEELFPRAVYPPNTLLVVAGLVKPEFLIEVEAIAAA